MSVSLIDLAIENRVAWLVLQRPTAANAFTGEMLLQLLAAVTRAANEADILVSRLPERTFPSGATGRTPRQAERLSMHSSSSPTSMPRFRISRALSSPSYAAGHSALLWA